MYVLNRLQDEVKVLDRKVRANLLDNYDWNAAHQRDLLEAAIKEIAHLRTHRDLAVSVLDSIGLVPREAGATS